MPSGRPLEYKKYTAKELVDGVTLTPCEDAVRAVVHAECGMVRWLSDMAPTKTKGFPLHPTAPETFDVDLDRLSFVAADQDAELSIYYYGS